MEDGGDRERPGTGRPAAPSARWRRGATAGWLCAVVLAALIGTWSFQYGTPDGRYARHGPLDDERVRQELARARSSDAPHRSGGKGADDSPPRSSPTASPSTATSSPPSTPETTAPHTATVRFPGGTGTATVECRPDGTVRLLSWSPADGYGADDVERGPARQVTIELEPPDDDESVDLAVRCDDGEPAAAVLPEDGDEDED
ncbi:hypothetical protein HCC61_11925 [Streptomyces sp. HNM0575]|uniref:hypothetical protein n=1 Tax=Streptomyces sp. HNM0575 TaxID=2716338 RepID=UPI00145CF391|nr:hypothetical protein [Streptomyces sp. HNM0575]NLU73377.1 hypothetical protein [Streptomyces sp. HNM0575]